MPDKQFTIEPLNPIGLFKLDDPYELNLNNDICYQQKYSEDATIQIKSDYAPIAKIYQAGTGYPVTAIPIIEVKSTNIQGETFAVYEITYPFGSLSGLYIVTLGYIDDNAQLIAYQSLVINCQTNHPNTLLFEYANDRNDFGVAFSTGITFKLRVEGVIREPSFKSNDVIYNDVTEDSVLLNSIPFRTFKLYCGVGNNGLLPHWMGDKINCILSCNQVQINDLYYSKVEGEELQIKRATPLRTQDKPNISLSTTIQPTKNISLQRLILGADLPQGYTPVSHVKNYFNVGSNFTTPSEMLSAFSLLTHVVVRNRGGAINSFRVGTTSGADDIVDETQIAAGVGNTNGVLTYPIFLDKFMDGPTTLYVSGVNGASCDILFHWLQFDEKTVVPGRETTVVKMPRNFVGYYDGTIEEINADFDLNSGFGRVGTEYEKAVICDGRNGTRDYGLRTIMGYKTNATWADLGLTPADPNHPELRLGDSFGAAVTTLSPANLPPLIAAVPSSTQSGSGRFVGNGGGNGLLAATVTGSGNQPLNNTPFTNLPPTILSLVIKFLE